MSITRRQFLLGMAGTASGLVVPDYITQAAQFVEKTGSPLILPPDEIVEEIYCEDYYGEYRLHLGGDDSPPEPMSYREYAEYTDWGSVNEFMTSWDVRPSELDEEIDYDFVIEYWARHHSPMAQAYHLLEGLDLMPRSGDPSAVGKLSFIDGYFPGHDYLGVHAADQMSLSLLQERLNQLHTGIHLVVEGAIEP